jgi:uncharacterized protein YlxW (UPF0749 family)
MRSNNRDNKESVVNKHLRRIEGRKTYAEKQIKNLETKLKSFKDEKDQALADKMKLHNENTIKPVQI